MNATEASVKERREIVSARVAVLKDYSETGILGSDDLSDIDVMTGLLAFGENNADEFIAHLLDLAESFMPPAKQVSTLAGLNLVKDDWTDPGRTKEDRLHDAAVHLRTMGIPSTITNPLWTEGLVTIAMQYEAARMVRRARLMVNNPNTPAADREVVEFLTKELLGLYRPSV